MKVLIISNLFPSANDPQRGVFNKQQFVELSKFCEVRVVAPLPWVPSFLKHTFTEVPEEETIEGLRVYHPRHFVIPKIGRFLNGFLFYGGILSTVKEIRKQFPFDIVLASWAYPDSFAAALVAQKLKKPLVVKVHGTDINTAHQYFLRPAMIRYALTKAEKIIAVTQDLKEKIVRLGVPQEKVAVIPNGVNTELFKKMDARECRNRIPLSANAKQVLFIGNLVPIKGVEYLIKAFKDVPQEVCLNIIGEGELRESLENLARECRVSSRVFFRGKRPHQEIPLWMNACDALCLPSLNEGCPNVILEALACGMPIVASGVGGIPEMIPEGKNGILVEPANPQALSQAIGKVVSQNRNGSLKDHGTLSWPDNARKVFEILKGALG